MKERKQLKSFFSDAKMRMTHRLVLFVNLESILTFFQGKTDSSFKFFFFLNFISIIRIISKRRLMLLQFLHFFIFLLNNQAIRKFSRFFGRNLLWTLPVLLGTAFLTQRGTWLNVILFFLSCWVVFLVRIFETIVRNVLNTSRPALLDP